MLKIKKKPFFLTLFVFVSILLIVIPLFFSYLSGYFLKSYSRKILGQEISYDSLKFENGKIVAKNIRGSSDVCDVKVDEVFFKIKLNIFTFQINSDISLVKPNIILKNKKSTDLLSQNFWKSKKNIIKSKINIKDGKIKIADDPSKQFYFSLEQKDFNDTFVLVLGFDEKLEKKIILQIKRQDENFLALLDFIKVPSCSLLALASNFYELNIKKMQGELLGNISLKISEKKKSSILFDLTFLDFLVDETSTNKVFGAKKLKIKGDSCSKISKSVLARFPLRLKSDVEGGFLFLGDIALLEDIEGSIFYNPDLGPNVRLKAKATMGEEKKECTLESRGYFKSNFCNWMDLDFSFSKDVDSGIFIKFFEKKKDELSVQVKMQEVGNEYFYLFQNILPKSIYDKFNISEGLIDLDAQAEIVKGSFQKVFFENFQIKDIKFQVDDYKIFAKDIRGFLGFDLKDIDSTLSSNLLISNASINIGKETLQDIKASLRIEKGFFEPSFLSFAFNDLKTNVKIDGNIEEFVSNIEVKGPTKNILKNSQNDQVLSVFSFKRKKEGGYFSGIIQLLEADNKEENIVFGFNLKKLSLDIKNSVSTGWIRGENFVLEKWGRFFKDLNLKGKANFSAFFQNDKFSLQFQAKNFQYATKDFRVDIEKVGSYEDVFFEKKDFVSFTYDLNSNLWNIEVPPLDGTYTMNSGLKFDCKNVKINNYRGVAEFVIPEALSENLNFNGKVFLDFLNNKLDIVTSSVKGKVPDLCRFAKHFDLSLPNIEGTFESSQDGFYFSKILKENFKPSMGANIVFNDLSYMFCDNVYLTKVKMQIDWDSKEDRLDFCDMEGSLEINKKNFRLLCPLFSKRNNQLVYDIRIAKPTLDLLRIKGSADFQNEKIHFGFDPECNFLGEQFFASLDLNKNFNEPSFSLEMNFDINKTFACLDINDFLGRKCEGFVNGKIEAANGLLKFEAKGKDLLLGEKKIGNFFLRGEKENKNYSIKELALNDLSSSFSLEKKDDKLHINALKITQKNSLLEGEGTYSKNKIDVNIKNLKLDLEPSNDFIKEFCSGEFLKSKLFLQGKGWISIFLKNSIPLIEADLDLSSSKLLYNNIWTENNGELNLCYSNEKGLKVNGLDLMFSSKELDLSSLKTKFKYLSYDPKGKKWLLKGGYLSFPVSLLKTLQNNSSGSFKQLFFITQNWLKIEKDLDLELEVEYENSVFKSFSKEACMYINGGKRELKDLEIKFLGNNCILDFKYLHENIYHQVSNILNFESFSGKLILGQEIDPLTIDWACDENGIIINKIIGNFSGLCVDVYLNDKKDKDTYSLFGSVKADFSRALFLLPVSVQKKLKSLRIAKGYEAQGYLNLLKSKPKFTFFEGKILGKDFEVAGFSLKTFFGDVKIWPDLLEITKLKISDLAGVFFVPRIDLGKIDDSWFFSVPSIEAFEIRPSLMKKIGEENNEIKPLVVKNFQLSNLKGKFNDSKTITGEGFFSFINSFKRGHSIFEIPSEMLGRIVGLDSELLVPVSGDVHYEIKNNKCSITKINDVYSENRRSQFFLIDTPYLDFDGNLNIEIKMKQYVLFKITDKFILSIKGTLAKPDLNLKKKKVFFSD